MSCKSNWEATANELEAAAKVSAGQVDGALRCNHGGCDQLVLRDRGVCLAGHSQEGKPAGAPLWSELTTALMCMVEDYQQQGLLAGDEVALSAARQLTTAPEIAASVVQARAELACEWLVERLDELRALGVELPDDPRERAARALLAAPAVLALEWGESVDLLDTALRDQAEAQASAGQRPGPALRAAPRSIFQRVGMAFEAADGRRFSPAEEKAMRKLGLVARRLPLDAARLTLSTRQVNVLALQGAQQAVAEWEAVRELERSWRETPPASVEWVDRGLSLWRAMQDFVRRRRGLYESQQGVAGLPEGAEVKVQLLALNGEVSAALVALSPHEVERAFPQHGWSAGEVELLCDPRVRQAVFAPYPEHWGHIDWAADSALIMRDARRSQEGAQCIEAALDYALANPQTEKTRGEMLDALMEGTELVRPQYAGNAGAYTYSKAVGRIAAALGNEESPAEDMVEVAQARAAELWDMVERDSPNYPLRLLRQQAGRHGLRGALVPHVTRAEAIAWLREPAAGDRERRQELIINRLAAVPERARLWALGRDGTPDDNGRMWHQGQQVRVYDLAQAVPFVGRIAGLRLRAITAPGEEKPYTVQPVARVLLIGGAEVEVPLAQVEGVR